MAIETKEITFEREIEYSLLDHGGYIKGNPRDYGKQKTENFKYGGTHCKHFAVSNTCPCIFENHFVGWSAHRMGRHKYRLCPAGLAFVGDLCTK